MAAKKQKSSYQYALDKGLVQTTIRFTPEQVEVIKQAAELDGRLWTKYIAHAATMAAKNDVAKIGSQKTPR